MMVTEGVATLPVTQCRPCLTLHRGGVDVSLAGSSPYVDLSLGFRILLSLSSSSSQSETMRADLVRVELRISEITQSYFYKDNFPEHS